MKQITVSTICGADFGFSGGGDYVGAEFETPAGKGCVFLDLEISYFSMSVWFPVSEVGMDSTDLNPFRQYVLSSEYESSAHIRSDLVHALSAVDTLADEMRREYSVAQRDRILVMDKHFKRII